MLNFIDYFFELFNLLFGEFFSLRCDVFYKHLVITDLILFFCLRDVFNLADDILLDFFFFLFLFCHVKVEFALNCERETSVAHVIQDILDNFLTADLEGECQIFALSSSHKAWNRDVSTPRHLSAEASFDFINGQVMFCKWVFHLKYKLRIAQHIV